MTSKVRVVAGTTFLCLWQHASVALHTVIDSVPRGVQQQVAM